MRKIVFGVVGAAALAMSSVASASITLNTCSMTCTGPSSLDGGITTTIGFSDSGLSSPTFTESLNFTDLDAAIDSVTLDTSSRAVNFTSAYLTDGVTQWALSLISSQGSNEFWGLSDTNLNAGTYSLIINGNNSGTGSLGGTVTITAVPEPATWAMMLLGFGAIGWQLRRRRSGLALAQAA